MLKLFLSNFKRTNENIILATPMVLCIIIINLYCNYIKNNISTFSQAIVSMLTLCILIGGSLSGFLYMTKKALSLDKRMFVYKKDQNNALKELFLAFPKGVGRLFPSVTLVIILSFLIVISAYLVTLAPMFINWTIKYYSIYTSSNLYKLVLLQMLTITYFWVLWIPEVVYNDKNPFKAFWKSLKNLKISFFKTTSLFLTIILIFISLQIIMYLLLQYPVAYFLALLTYYYALLYIIILVFSYYEKNFYK